MRVATRLAIASAFLVLLLVACALTAIWLYSNAYKDRVAQDSVLLAEQIVGKIQSNIQWFREDMELFLAAVDLGDRIPDDLDEKGLSALLTRRFREYFENRYGYRLYEEAMVTDSEGNQIASTSGKEHPGVSEQAWWQEAMRTGSAFSPVAFREHVGKYGAVQAVVIRNSDGERVGVLWAVVAVPALVRDKGFLSKQYPSTAIDLVDREGRLLYSSRLFRYLEDVSGEPYYQQLTKGPGVLQAVVRGEEQLLVSYPFAGTGPAARMGWRLIIHQNRNEVMGTGIRLRNGLLAATLVTLFLAGLLSYLLARSITSRLGRLAAAATALGSGELFRRAEVAGRDEIAQLGGVFNRMAENLERSTEELNQEIEERQRAEESLAAQAELLKRSNEELEQFAYVASHDLQEPLRIIVSYLQLIERRYKNSLDQDGEKFIQATISGAERMRALIRGLLQYSRVSTKGRPFEAVDMNSVLDEALENLGEAVKESGARVEKWDLPTVHGDRIQLVQLLQNLIGNGIKFQAEGNSPEIRIEATRKEGHWWEFTVSDNGIGIESQYAERIFGLFQRLHSRGSYEGTGIGLSVCKRIIERHHGRIWLESEPGKGTTFHFTLRSGG